MMDTTRTEPLSSSDGALLYWIGINLDIDDAMRAEETLTAVRERLAPATQAATCAQLSAAIAHEIVQPLSALVANARAALHWLEGDPTDIARAASLIAIVLRDGMWIGNVVHEMRRLFKAQSLSRTIVQPNELIRQVVLVVGRDLLGKGIELSLDLDPHLPGEVEVDAIQIQHLLLNLLRNASASFTSRSEAPSTVTVRSRAIDPGLVIEVEDNGAYVRDPEKVFETSTIATKMNCEWDSQSSVLSLSRTVKLSLQSDDSRSGCDLASHCRSGTPLPKHYSVLFWRSSKLGPIHKHVMDSRRRLTYDGEHPEL
jgi:K+-sensing histidine kinase KdpD